jgi:glutaredoxin
MRKVIIYSRPGCHLCEVAKSVIQQSDCGGKYTLDEVNIETDEKLLSRYKNDIPVILIDGVEAFRHRVSADEFDKAILKGQTD